jgi:hypothetical protein
MNAPILKAAPKTRRIPYIIEIGLFSFTIKPSPFQIVKYHYNSFCGGNTAIKTVKFFASFHKLIEAMFRK